MRTTFEYEENSDGAFPILFELLLDYSYYKGHRKTEFCPEEPPHVDDVNIIRVLSVKIGEQEVVLKDAKPILAEFDKKMNDCQEFWETVYEHASRHYHDAMEKHE